MGRQPDRQTYMGTYRHYPSSVPSHVATTQRWDTTADERADEGKTPIGFQVPERTQDFIAEIISIKGFDLYQQRAALTAVYPYAGAPDAAGVLYPALGLAGEAGEVAEKIKKLWRNKDLKLDAEDVAAVEAEIGDVLWYCAALATELGSNLGRIAAGNLKKLSDRQERGVIKSEGDNR